jgi:hypothetical protein
MDHEEPASLNLTIAAFRTSAEALAEAEIGGAVDSLRISELRPDLQTLRGALAVEVMLSVSEGGHGGGLKTWLVAGDGRVIGRLEEDQREGADQDGSQSSA